MITTVLITLITFFWGSVNHFFTLLQISNAIANIGSLISNFLTYVPSFSTFISYVYFFIPKGALQPLCIVALSCGLIRLGFSLIKIFR